jgi:hypothetical protein
MKLFKNNEDLFSVGVFNLLMLHFGGGGQMLAPGTIRHCQNR